MKIHFKAALLAFMALMILSVSHVRADDGPPPGTQQPPDSNQNGEARFRYEFVHRTFSNKGNLAEAMTSLWSGDTRIQDDSTVITGVKVEYAPTSGTPVMPVYTGLDLTTDARYIAYIDSTNELQNYFAPLRTRNEFWAFVNNHPAAITVVPGCAPQLVTLCGGRERQLPLARNTTNVDLFYNDNDATQKETWTCDAPELPAGKWKKVSETGYCVVPTCDGAAAAANFDSHDGTGSNVAIWTRFSGIPWGTYQVGQTVTISGHVPGFCLDPLRALINYTCMPSGSWEVLIGTWDCVNIDPPQTAASPPPSNPDHACGEVPGDIPGHTCPCPADSPWDPVANACVNPMTYVPPVDYTYAFFYGDNAGGSSGCGTGDAGSSGDCCFPSDTPVTMADKSMKPISKIVAGDKVMSYKPTGEITETTVNRVVMSPEKSLVRVNGVPLTPQHPVQMADGKFKWASLLKKGDKMVGQDGLYVTVTSLEPVEGKYATYNLETQDFSPFIAMGIRVGSYECDCIK